MFKSRQLNPKNKLIFPLLSWDETKNLILKDSMRLWQEGWEEEVKWESFISKSECCHKLEKP